MRCSTQILRQLIEVDVLKIAKPPVALKVQNLENLTRLALALTDSPPPMWQFKHKGKLILGTFSVYMSWKGDIPLFAFTALKRRAGAFLAYRNDLEREECIFTDNIEDTRYIYSPIINFKSAPAIFRNSLDGKWSYPHRPVTVELENLNSLMRLLFLISTKDYISFPIWRFKNKGNRILGVCIPFEHYYDANALPVFFYIKEGKPSSAPFVKYTTSKIGGETVEYSRTADNAKFFYVKIIDVDEMPLFPK
jgi:hypothetical protein